jgi:hypothetical protein
MIKSLTRVIRVLRQWCDWNCRLAQTTRERWPPTGEDLGQTTVATRRPEANAPGAARQFQSQASRHAIP